MGTKLQEEIGKRIRARRIALGISQEQLADLAKTHRTYIGMLERAEKNVSVVTLAAIVKALGKTLSEFLEGLQ